MSEDQIKIGQAKAHWNVSGTRILKYSVEMYHEGLREHKLISAPQVDILEKKVTLQYQKWTDKWDTIESKRRIIEKREASLEEANARTEQAVEALEQIDNLLIHTLSIDDTVDWESLKKKEEYLEKRPAKPSKKDKKAYPQKPEKSSDEFTPEFGFFEKLFKTRKERKILEFDNKYSAAIKNWEEEKVNIDKLNVQLEKEFEDELKKWEKEVEDWEKRKNEFLQKQTDFNVKIDQMRGSYLNQNITSVVEYCEMVLNNSKYPDSFPKNFELEYNPDTKILIVEYELPPIECFPSVKEVKYIASRKE
jgi:restriction system protein